MRHIVYCPHSRLAACQPNDVVSASEVTTLWRYINLFIIIIIIIKRPGWTAQAPLGWAYLHSSLDRLYSLL